MTKKDMDFMIKKSDGIEPSNAYQRLKNEIDEKIYQNNKNIEIKEISTNKNKSIPNEDEDFYKTNKTRINSKTKKKHKKRKRKSSRNSELYTDKKICIEGCIGCNIF